MIAYSCDLNFKRELCAVGGLIGTKPRLKSLEDMPFQMRLQGRGEV